MNSSSGFTPKVSILFVNLWPELLISFAHLGSQEKESFVDGGIIFINRDHPLFKKVDGKTGLVFYHLIRLVSQELIKFAYPKNIDVAFDWQGKLIADAYNEKTMLNEEK